MQGHEDASERILRVDEDAAIAATENEQLLRKIRTSYQASDGVYGSPRVHRDLREDGERCGEHRVARLMRINGLRAIRGYKKPRYRVGKPAIVAPNRIEQNFSVEAPDRVWATDITYIRTFEGWLYLAVVVDLYSRIVVGWSMKSTLSRELVLDALLMAVWRRRPKHPVIVHSDQGSQYGSDDAVRFCKDHGLIPSMSRRGNCFDNAVAESFLALRGNEWVILPVLSPYVVDGLGGYGVISTQSIWQDFRMRKHRRLHDAYRFPGFRPVPIVRGIFGDPKARILRLERRGKKPCVAPAGRFTGPSTTTRSAWSGISPVATRGCTWSSRSGGSCANGAGR